MFVRVRAETRILGCNGGPLAGTYYSRQISVTAIRRTDERSPHLRPIRRGNNGMVPCSSTTLLPTCTSFVSTSAILRVQHTQNSPIISNLLTAIVGLSRHIRMAEHAGCMNTTPPAAFNAFFVFRWYLPFAAERRL